jgi:hypothetical protein
MAVAEMESPPNVPRLISSTWAFAGIVESIIATTGTTKLRQYLVVFMIQLSIAIKQLLGQAA